MHLPVDKDTLARVVSAKLAGGNHDEYSYQEDCGSSDTTSYVRLIKKSDIHHTVLVGVSTAIATDRFEQSLLQRRFDQNAAFLTQDIGNPTAHHYHPLCPVVLAIGQPHADFAYSWIAYKDVEGWPLSTNWHQLKPEIRVVVIENIGTFVRELAGTQKGDYQQHRKCNGPSVDYVGSASKEHLLFPPILAANPSYWLSAHELEGLSNHVELVCLLADTRVIMLERHVPDAGTKSLAAELLRSIIPVARAVLEEQDYTVMAHLNLLPQNIWIDPFTGKLMAIFGWEYAHWAPEWMATAPLVWLMDEKADFMLESEKLRDPWVVWRPHFDHPPKNTAKEMRKLRLVWNTTLRSKSEVYEFSFGKEETHRLKRTAAKVCFVEEPQLPHAVDWARKVVQPFASTHIRVFWENLRVWVVLVSGLAGLIVYLGRNGVVPVVAAYVTIAILLYWVVSSILNSEGDREHAVMTFEPGMSASMLGRLNQASLKAKFPWAFGYSGDMDGKAGDKPLAAVPCSPANSIVPTGIYVVPSFLSRATTMMSGGPTAIEGEK